MRIGIKLTLVSFFKDLREALAEGKRFELSIRFNPYNGLANQK